MCHIIKGTKALVVIFVIMIFVPMLYAEDANNDAINLNKLQDEELKGDSVYSCADKVISIGQTAEQVKNSLGDPLDIEKEEVQGQKGEIMSNAAWIYVCEDTPYIFIFQNDMLISIYPADKTDTKERVNDALKRKIKFK